VKTHADIPKEEKMATSERNNATSVIRWSKLRLGIVYLIFLVTPAGAADAPRMTGGQEVNPVSTQEAIAVHAQYLAAFNRRDADALSALFTKDALFIDGEGKTVRGQSAIKEMFQQSFAAVDMMIEAEALQIEAVGGGAWEAGSGAQVFKGGEGIRRLPFHYTVVYRQDEGRLRVHMVNLGMDPVLPPR
jgi:uncharacterized protein (TIGR02246 family)